MYPPQPCVCAAVLVLLSLVVGSHQIQLVDNSIIATIRVKLQEWGPSRKFYQPTQMEKNKMRGLFDAQVGMDMINTMSDKMMGHVLMGFGKGAAVRMKCPNNVKIISCGISVLNGMTRFLPGATEFDFVQTKTGLVSNMVLSFDSIYSYTDITYRTGGVHYHVSGRFFYAPKTTQNVTIEVILQRKWYLWFIPSFCFVYISRMRYPIVTGEVDMSLDRETIWHWSRGANSLWRHPEIKNIMDNHLKSEIPPTVIDVMEGVLDDYRRNYYVCKT